MPITFTTVVQAAGAFPDVQASRRYDGATVLKVRGTFVAGIASHPSAEPGSLVVRMAIDDRAWLLEEAPETYYVTDFYRRYPVVLARLSAMTPDALHDLLSSSRTLALEKVRKPRADHHPRAAAR